MRRNAQEVRLRHDRQHGHKAIALNRAARRASGQLVEGALECRPRNALALWEHPLEVAPIDLAGSARSGERVTAPRNHDKTVVEKDIDAEFVTVDRLVDPAEHEIKITLPELTQKAAAHSIRNRHAGFRTRRSKARQNGRQQAESGEGRCADPQIAMCRRAQMRDVVFRLAKFRFNDLAAQHERLTISSGLDAERRSLKQLDAELVFELANAPAQRRLREAQLVGRLPQAAVFRCDARPDIPTAMEQGVPGFSVSTWFAIFGPAGLSPDIVAKIRNGVEAVLQSERSAEFLKINSCERMKVTPQQVSEIIAADYSHWRKVIQMVGIQAE
jgi:tripartite tricarboxylate transporter family receptor